MQTLNPAIPGGSSSYGLNRFGPTAIRSDGATIFAHICHSLATLYSGAPVRVALGSRPVKYEMQGGGIVSQVRIDKPDPAEEYEDWYFERDKLVEAFSRLAYMGDSAATGEFYLGISVFEPQARMQSVACGFGRMPQVGQESIQAYGCGMAWSAAATPRNCCCCALARPCLRSISPDPCHLA